VADELNPNIDLASCGLGLDYGTVALQADAGDVRAKAFARLAGTLGEVLGSQAGGIEHVGSTAVPGLVAKPIIDVAVALKRDADVADARTRLERAGFEFRGDKGDQGGLLFVLESAPMRRVAHVHLVHEDGTLWRRYIKFRDRLRADESARASYAALKGSLAERHPDDRAAYTAGKEAFIARLLDDIRPPHGQGNAEG
jgi:GrpB-like predicted nucleotidyltransferase (UPF0157 family)